MLNELCYKLLRSLLLKSITVNLCFWLVYSQCVIVNASEISGTFNSSLRNPISHHELGSSLSHENGQVIMGLNSAIVYPQAEISSVLHSIVNSSLDLNSLLKSINIGNLPHEININLGSHSLPVHNNQALTPAEAIAVNQVLSNNHQALVLNALGQAIGGSLNVSYLGANLNNLELAKGITLVDNSGKLIVSGDLANYGNIVFTGSGNLTANNILNETGAQISSSGTLGLTTNALINEGGIYGANGVNLNAPVIYNAGTIEAGLGNINIANANALDISGTQNSIFEVSYGNINVNVNATSLFTNPVAGGINLTSGNYLSNELNLNANSGYIQGLTGNVTGQINIKADSVHLATQSNDMVIGNAKVNGDPTYVNTAGDITLNGTITTNGANLAIIASGNINVASGSATSINTQGSNSNGGNVVMIAGVGRNISYSGSNTTTGIPVPGTAIGNTETVTVQLGATYGNTGGNIDLVTNNTLANDSTVINTAGTAINAIGGSVTLVAQANGSSGGEVLTSNGSTSYGIEIGGSATGSSDGHVTIIGSSTSGNGVELGTITGASSSFTSGTNIAIYTANPSGNVSFDSLGTQTGLITASTTSLIGSNIVLNGSIDLGPAGLTVTSGGSLNLSTFATLYTNGGLNLTATTGNIASNIYPIITNATFINITALNGSAYINDSTATLTLSTSTVSSTGELTITMTNSTQGSINVTGVISAGSDSGTGIINLTSSGANGNINSPGSGLVQSGSINFVTNGGSVGSNGTVFNIDASSISVNTGSGTSSPSVSFTDSYNGTIDLASGSVGNINIGNGGSFSLQMTNSSQGGINLTNPLTIVDGTVTLISSGSGTIAQNGNTSNLLTAANISLSTTGTSIGLSSQPFLIKADTLNVSTLNNGATSGSIFISDQNSLTFVNASAETQVNLTVNGNVNTDTISGNVISITTLNNGNIDIDGVLGNVTVYSGNIQPTSSITLTASGSGNISAYYPPIFVSYPAGGYIYANNIVLNSGTGDIGQNFTGIPTKALTLMVNTNGNVYINNQNVLQLAVPGTNNSVYYPLNILNSSSGNSSTFELVSSNSIIVNGTISAGVYNGSGTIKLISQGQGSITQTNTTDLLTAGNINFNVINGETGSASLPIYINSSVISVNNWGSVYLNDAASVNILSSFTSGIFSLVDNASVTMDSTQNVTAILGLDIQASTGIIVSNLNAAFGGIALTTTNGNLTVNSGSVLDAGNGTLILNNTNTSTGSILIGSNAILVGTNANSPSNSNEVIIAIGNIPSIPVNTLIPSNVTVNATNGGNAYFGVNSIYSSSPDNTISANTYNVVFSGSSNTSPITLNGGVTIYSQSGVVIPSLDLTQSSGSIIFYPQDILSNLSALNIPSNVTVSIIGLSNRIPINEYVNITSSSTSNTVTISGTEQFITSGGGSLANLYTNSSIAINGNLTSDGSLNVNSDGSFNLASNSTVSAVNNVSITTSQIVSYSDNTIILSGNISASASNSIVTLASGLILSQSTSQLISAGSINFTSYDGTIGNYLYSYGFSPPPTGSSIEPIYINSQNLNILMTGTPTSFNAVYLNDAAINVNVSNSNVQISNAGVFYLAMSNPVSGSIIIGNGGLGNQSTSTVGQINYFPTVDLTASGSGSISALASVDLVTASNINLTSNIGNIGNSTSTPLYIYTNSLTANSSQGSVYLNDSALGVVSLANPSSAGASGVFDLTSASGLNLSWQISAGTDTGTGKINITITGSGDIINGLEQNFVAGTVNIITAGGNIGSLTNQILVDTNNLAFTTGPNTALASVFINDSYMGILNLSTSSVGSSGTIFLQTSGGLNINGLINAGNDLGNGIINLITLNSGNINDSSSNLLTAGSISIKTNTGIIGTSTSNPLYIDTGNLNVITSQANVFINNINLNTLNLNNSVIVGGFSLVDNGMVVMSSSTFLQVVQNISISASTGLTVNNIIAANGGISLFTTGGILNVNSLANIDADNGNLIIDNLDSSNGSIFIGNNASLNGFQINQPSNNNEVIIAIGNIPSIPTNSTIPANVIVNSTNTANVYFGINSITANAPNNIINANTYNVVFSGGSSSTPITLNGSVNINSQPGVFIPSLDLTQGFVTAILKNLQSTGLIGGTLTTNSSGSAVGGNVIFTTQDYLGDLSAQNIPANVTVTLSGFTVNNPVNVNLSNVSTTGQVIINGTEQFITSGGGSFGQININSLLTSAIQPLLSIGGSLTSDGSLNLNVPGNINIANNAIVSGVNSINILTSNGSNGSITNDGNITASSSSSSITLIASGSGSITSGSSTDLITANTVNLTSLNQNIGLSSISPIYINASNLFINTQLSSYINDSAASLTLTSSSITIGNSAVLDLVMSNNSNGSIVIGSGGVNIGAGTLDLSVTGTVTQLSASDVISANTINFNASYGNIGTSSTNLLNINAQNISFNSIQGSGYINDNYIGNIYLNASRGLGSNDLYLTSTSGIIINGTVDFLNISISAGGNGNISSGNANDIIYGNNMSFTSLTGNIGLSSSNPLFINSEFFSVSNNASAYINNATSSFNYISSSTVSVGSNQTFSLYETGLNFFGIIIDNSLSVGTDTGTGSIILNAGTTGSITQSASSDIITARNISLVSANGNIGSSSTNPLYIDTANLSVNSAGDNVFINNSYTGNLSLNGSSANDNFVLTDSGSVTMASLTSLNANLGVSITSASGLAVNNIAVISGTISLITNAGILDVMAGATLYAGNGSILLNNLNSTNGSINIGANVNLTGYSGSAPSNNNEVILAIGAIPTTPVNNAIPANVTVNTSNSANVYFGTNSITANAPNNIVNANTWNVVFNGSSSTTPITLDGGVTINTKPGFYINSLDLTNSTVTGNIIALQSNGSIGGNLIVNASGVATGGNVIFYGSKDNLSQLTAEDIPANVTVEFNSFASVNPIQVNLTNSSTSQQVLINGTEEFITTGGGSQALVNISSSLTTITQPLMTVGGSLTSDGSLSVNVAGSIVVANNAIVSSSGNLSLEAAGNITVANSGGISSQGNITIQNAIGSNGSIAISGEVSVNSTTGIITLASDGSGSIYNTNMTNAITANTLNLITTGGNIGLSIASPLYIKTNNINFSTNSLGSVYVFNLSPTLLNIGPLNSENIYIGNISNIDVVGNLNASGNITVGSGLNLAIDANITATNTAYIEANQIGNITAASSADVVSAGTVYLSTVGENIGSSSQAIFVNTENLNVYVLSGLSTASAYVNDINTNLLNLNSAQIANLGSFFLTTASSCNITGPINSGIAFNLNAMGNIIIGNSVTGNANLNIDFIANGNISSLANSDVLTAGDVNLDTSATGSDIGSLANGIMVDASNVGITTGGSTGSAYVNDISANNITITQAIVGNGSTDTFGFAGNNSSTTSISTASGLTVTAPNVIVASVNGNIGTGTGSTQTFNIDSNNVTFNATSNSVYVNDSASGNINFVNVVYGTNTVTNAADMNGGGTYFFTASNTTTAGNLVTASGESISGNYLILNSSLGFVGNSTNVLSTDANNLTLMAATDSYISNSATTGVNLNASTVGASNTLSLTSASAISVNGLVSAGANNGSGNVDLTAGGTGNITSTNSSDVVTTGTIALVAGTGNIGTATNNLYINADNLSVNSSGSSYLNDAASVATVNNANIVVGSSNVFSLTMNNTISGSIVIGAGGLVVGTDTGTGAVYLTTSGSGTITQTTVSDIVTAGTVNLASGSSDIGAGNAFVIDATNLSANTSGNVNVLDSNVSNVNLNVSTGNVFTLTASGSNTNLNVLGALAANTVNLNTTANGNINIANVISATSLNDANTINLTANGSGNIVNEVNSSNPRLLAQTVNLFSTTGNIGSTGVSGAAAINTDALIFTVNTAGNAYVSDTNSPAATIGNSTANNFVVNTTTNGANIQVSGTVTASSVDFTTNSGNIITTGNMNIANRVNFNTNGVGGITINSQVGSSTSNDTLNSTGYGYITSGTKGMLIGNGLSLVSNGGEIGFGVNGLTPFMTQATNLVFSAAQSVGIFNHSNSLNIAASGSGANLYVENTGNITASGMITAPVLGLYSFGGSGGVGSASNIIQVNAVNIGMQALGTGGSVYVNDTYTGSVVLQASQASNILKLDTAGPLTIYALVDQGGVITPGIIGGSIIAIQTLSGYGIYNAANIEANDFIFLTASQNGYIAEPTTGALMYAPNVSLVSGGGAIGAGPVGSRLLVNSGRVSASTQGLNSFVNIYDEAANSGIVGGQSGSYFTFNTNGNVNIYGGIGTGAGSNANGGAINITANGALNVGVNGTGIPMTTNNGPIVVIDNNSNAGAINIAKGSFIYTNTAVGNPGYIVFNVGPYAQTNTTNPNPSAISVQSSGGATVFFGNHGIEALAGGNVLNAKGQSIVFNTGALAASALTLGGNVSVIADPPVASTGVAAIQNNLATYGVYSQSASANAQAANNNQGVANVLDNNQAGLNTNANVQDNQNMETRYLTNNNDDNNEIVENTSLVMPIAYNHEVASLTAQAINANNGLAVSKAAKGQTSGLTFGNGTNNANLGQGSAIISASHDMVVTLGLIKPVKLSLKLGALVLAIANGGVESVFNLHDNTAGSVVVQANGIKAISLAPGRHVSLANANQAVDFAYINQVRKIGYRSIKANTSNGVATYVSDFSIPSAISAVKPLKAMIRSNDKQVKALANQLLKTSVVVTQSTSGSGVYEQVAKPKLTAMN